MLFKMPLWLSLVERLTCNSGRKPGTSDQQVPSSNLGGGSFPFLG